MYILTEICEVEHCISWEPCVDPTHLWERLL